MLNLVDVASMELSKAQGEVGSQGQAGVQVASQGLDAKLGKARSR